MSIHDPIEHALFAREHNLNPARLSRRHRRAARFAHSVASTPRAPRPGPGSSPETPTGSRAAWARHDAMVYKRELAAMRAALLELHAPRLDDDVWEREASAEQAQEESRLTAPESPRQLAPPGLPPAGSLVLTPGAPFASRQSRLV